jgi:hypothetical protein
LITDLGAEGMTMVDVGRRGVHGPRSGGRIGPAEQIFGAAETDRLRRFLAQVL